MIQTEPLPRFEVLSTTTAPLVVEDVPTPQGLKDLVFVVANDDTVNAIDAATGTIAWKEKFPNPLKPKTEANYLGDNRLDSSGQVWDHDLDWFTFPLLDCMEQINVGAFFNLGKMLNNIFAFAKQPIKVFLPSLERSLLPVANQAPS